MQQYVLTIFINFHKSTNLFQVVYPLLELLIDGPRTISACSPFSLVASVLGRLNPILVSTVQWALEGNSSEVVQFNAALSSNPTASTFVLSISEAADISLLQENKEYSLVATIVDSLGRTFNSLHSIILYLCKCIIIHL